MEKVLITGVGGPAGRAASAFFQDKGFTVIGTDITPVSTKVDEFFLVPRGDTPEFSQTIMRILATEKPLLFVPTVSEELPQAARLRSGVRALGIRMFSSGFEAVSIANDKYLTARQLAMGGVAVPRTLANEDVESAVVAGDLLGYPLVVKPRVGRGGKGVRVLFGRKEAEAETRRGIVYQEFLSGEEFDVNLFVYPEGNATIARVLLKTRLKEGIVGNALEVKPVKRADVEALAIRAASVLKLEGPIDMDIRLNSNGIPKVLEVNARVGANVLKAEGVLDTMLLQSFIKG